MSGFIPDDQILNTIALLLLILHYNTHGEVRDEKLGVRDGKRDRFTVRIVLPLRQWHGPASYHPELATHKHQNHYRCDLTTPPPHTHY